MALRFAALLGNIVGVAYAGGGAAMSIEAVPAASSQPSTSDAFISKECQLCAVEAGTCLKDCGSSYAWKAISKVRDIRAGGSSKTSTSLLAVGLAVSMLAVSCFITNRILRLVLYFLFSNAFFSAAVITIPTLRTWAYNKLVISAVEV
jgi:hypothetical protein